MRQIQWSESDFLRLIFGAYDGYFNFPGNKALASFSANVLVCGCLLESPRNLVKHTHNGFLLAEIEIQ